MSFFPANRISVVCEIGPNHNGVFDNAIRLIGAAKAAGATHVKFQAFTPDELVTLRGDGRAPEPWGSQGWSVRDLYAAVQTPLDWFPRLSEYCSEVGIPWFSSVCGAESLAVLEAVGCPAYKLAAMECHNHELRDMARATGKPVVRSAPWTGGLTPGADVAVFCPPGYPQPVALLHEMCNYDGYSYHGKDPDIPAYAVAAGARYIETHLMLADEPSRFEAEFAFNEEGFAEMVRRIRKAEAAL